jgi:hypothetical protein
MDDKGVIFTLDAVMGLVILFILLTVVNSANNAQLSPSPQIRLSHSAQDTLESMATYKTCPEGFTVLQNVAVVLAAHNNDKTGIDEAGQAAGAYLNMTLGSSKYNFTELSEINSTIAANADMKDAANVAVGVMSYEGYMFKLYIWD